MVLIKNLKFFHLFIFGHGFEKKLKFFHLFIFGKIRKKNVFDNILERKKSFFIL